MGGTAEENLDVKLKSLDTFKGAVREHWSFGGKNNNLEYISMVMCNLLLRVLVCSVVSNFLQSPCNPSGSSVYEILQERTGLPFPPAEDLSDTGIETWSPALQTDSSPFELQGSNILLL